MCVTVCVCVCVCVCVFTPNKIEIKYLGFLNIFRSLSTCTCVLYLSHTLILFLSLCLFAEVQSAGYLVHGGGGGDGQLVTLRDEVRDVHVHVI